MVLCVLFICIDTFVQYIFCEIDFSVGLQFFISTELDKVYASQSVSFFVIIIFIILYYIVIIFKLYYTLDFYFKNKFSSCIFCNKLV
jgi:hypothetical protein